MSTVSILLTPVLLKALDVWIKLPLKRCWKWPASAQRFCRFGAVEFAGKYNVTLRVLHSFEDGPGTLITLEEQDEMEQPVVSGIAFNRDEAKLTIKGVPDIPGVASRILGPISKANVEVDMIVQNVADDKSTDFTFTVHRNDFQKALAVVGNTSDELGAREFDGDNRIAKVSIVGVGMQVPCRRCDADV